MTAVLEGGEWSAARPGCTLPPQKDLVPIVQEAGWAPGPVWTGGKSRPHRDPILDRPARSQSLYRLSYPAHLFKAIYFTNKVQMYAKMNYYNVSTVKTGCGHMNGI